MTRMHKNKIVDQIIHLEVYIIWTLCRFLFFLKIDFGDCLDMEGKQGCQQHSQLKEIKYFSHFMTNSHYLGCYIL